jgi:hypothetical protein
MTKKVLTILFLSCVIFCLFTPSVVALNRNDIISQKISQKPYSASISIYDSPNSNSIIDNVQADEHDSPLSSLFDLGQYDSLLEFFQIYHPGYHTPGNTMDFVDIPSRKPNIYLYNDQDLCAQVRLVPENAITVSEPVYQPGIGWQAKVWDGSLNGQGDFLFYEALVPDSVWQKVEGYIIRAAYREQDMAVMLGQYGFNEKETADFIDYWTVHLADEADYVFYPQETGAVDEVMPLFIVPQPDDVMRIWFYAEPMVSAPEPVTNPERIVRDGFYVVEWGVMIQDEL